MSAADIVEGDILVVDSTEYPIRSVAEWAGFPPGSLAFKRLASITAATKRPPQLTGGTRGAAVAHLANVKCTPLDPVNAELQARLKLNTPHEVLECYVDGDPYLRLVVEDLRT